MAAAFLPPGRSSRSFETGSDSQCVYYGLNVNLNESLVFLKCSMEHPCHGQSLHGMISFLKMFAFYLFSENFKDVYNISCLYLPLTPWTLPQESLSHLPLSMYNLLFTFKPLSLISAVHIDKGMGPFFGAREYWPASSHMPKEKWFSSQKPPIAKAPQLGSGVRGEGLRTTSARMLTGLILYKSHTVNTVLYVHESNSHAVSGSSISWHPTEALTFILGFSLPACLHSWASFSRSISLLNSLFIPLNFFNSSEHLDSAFHTCIASTLLTELFPHFSCFQCWLPNFVQNVSCRPCQCITLGKEDSEKHMLDLAKLTMQRPPLLWKNLAEGNVTEYVIKFHPWTEH